MMQRSLARLALVAGALGPWTQQWLWWSGGGGGGSSMTLFASADFVYPDFNQTLGLVFNGDAATSSCTPIEPRAYGDVEGDADRLMARLAMELEETIPSHSETVVETHVADAVDDGALRQHTAGFGNLDEYQRAPKTDTGVCPVRLRMTKSAPRQAGAVWYESPLPVVNGFATEFTLQVSDHSRECTRHRDADFSLSQYESCAVAGGDGLAFVLHGDDNGTAALGEAGGELGYGGLSRALVVEFDLHYHPPPPDGARRSAGHGGRAGGPGGAGDLPLDHVTVHSAGNGRVDASPGSAVSVPRAHSLADGAVHRVKVAYLPRVAVEYMSNFTATKHGVDLSSVVDFGENRRLGTLVVWLDGGIAADVPLLAVPINLAALLTLPQDRAYVGFTAATGRRWQKHDVLAWHWCDDADCTVDAGAGFRARSEEAAAFDYHQTSKYGARKSERDNNQRVPGVGFGAGVDPDGAAPTKHASPDDSPWAPPRRPGALQPEGLASGAALQVPPATLIR